LEPWREQEIFSSLHPSRPALGATQPPLQWVPGFLAGPKAAESWRALSVSICRRG